MGAACRVETNVSDQRKQIVVAVTGASGALYATRLLQVLTAADVQVHLVISPYGRRLFADELNIRECTPAALVGDAAAARITPHEYRDVGSKLASGSFLTNGMVICPCSSNTLADVAGGSGSNLISRAAAVHFKEMRRLIVVPREMPLSIIEMENMLRIARAGGVVCPASPGFYMLPKSLEELADFVVGKLCDLLGVEHSLRTRYKPANDTE